MNANLETKMKVVNGGTVFMRSERGGLGRIIIIRLNFTRQECLGGILHEEQKEISASSADFFVQHP